MIIGQIKDGIVLDHITAGNGMNIYNVLKLRELDCAVALIQKVDSTKMGKKDIIKIGEIIDLDFELLGFIEQLHTSSGRIPSEKGYRFYVDSLLSPMSILYFCLT